MLRMRIILALGYGAHGELVAGGSRSRRLAQLLHTPCVFSCSTLHYIGVSLS